MLRKVGLGIPLEVSTLETLTKSGIRSGSRIGMLFSEVSEPKAMLLELVNFHQSKLKLENHTYILRASSR